MRTKHNESVAAQKFLQFKFHSDHRMATGFDEVDTSLDALEAAILLHSSPSPQSGSLEGAAQHAAISSHKHAPSITSTALSPPAPARADASPSKSPQPLGAATQQELGALFSAAGNSPDSLSSGVSGSLWAHEGAGTSPADSAASQNNSPHAQEVARHAQAALASAASSPSAESEAALSPLGVGAPSPPPAAAGTPPQYLQDTANALHALQEEHTASPSTTLQSEAMFDVSPASLQPPPQGGRGGSSRRSTQGHSPGMEGTMRLDGDMSSDLSGVSEHASLFRGHTFHSPAATTAPTSASAAPSASGAADALDLSALSVAVSAAEQSFASQHSRQSAASRRTAQTHAQVGALQSQLAEANAYIAQLQRAVTAAEQSSERARHAAAAAVSAAQHDAELVKQRCAHTAEEAHAQLAAATAKLHTAQQAETQARREVQTLQTAARRQAAAAPPKPEKEGGAGGALQQCRTQLEAARTALATAKAVHQKAQAQWGKQEATLKQFAQQAGAAKTASDNAARAAEKRAAAADTRAAGLQKQMGALQRRAEAQEQRLAEVPAVAALQSQLRALGAANDELRAELAATEAAHTPPASAEEAAQQGGDSAAELRRQASELSSLRSQRARLLARCQSAQGRAEAAEAAVAGLRGVAGTVRWLATQAGIPVPEHVHTTPLGELGAEAQQLLRGVAAALRTAQREAQAAAADAAGAHAAARTAAVDIEMLRSEMEKMRAAGAAFGQPASSQQVASDDQLSRLQQLASSLQEQLAAQSAKAEHASRKLAAQEVTTDQLRTRVAELMAKAEQRTQRNQAAFERVFGRAARAGSLVDAVPLQLTAAYESKLAALQAELQDAQAMLAERAAGTAVPGSSDVTATPDRDTPSPLEDEEQQPEQPPAPLPPASAESMLATPHAQVELLKQRALTAQLRGVLADTQARLGAAQAECSQLQGALQDLRQRHNAAVARSAASLDKLQGELSSRPSAKEWVAARQRMAAVEAELEAAAEAGFDRAVLQLRAQQSQREAAAGAALARPGVLAAQDRTAHALHGLAPRLRALPRDAASGILQELCSELQIEDPSATPGAVRTLKSAVAFLPALDAVVSQVAAVGVAARVATGAVQEHLCGLLGALGVQPEHFLEHMAEAATEARKGAPELPGTVATAVLYLQGAVQHVLLLPLLCQLLQQTTGALQGRHASHSQAMAQAFSEGCAQALAEAATQPPPVLASEPGMASWLQAHISSSRGGGASTAASALGGMLQELVATEAEAELVGEAFRRADAELQGVPSEQRVEQAVLLHFQRALGVSSTSECIPALAKLLNSQGVAPAERGR